MSNIKDINLLDAVDIYKLVLERKIKIFPMGFWTKPEALENSAKCVKYLLEEKLGFCEQDIKENFSLKLIKENKLAGMLICCFNGVVYDAIDNAYPNKFKPWEFKKLEMGKWTEKNSKEATKWLIEEKLKLCEVDIKEQLSANLFSDNGLGGMLRTCFNNSPYDAINSAYPNKYKIEDFRGYKLNWR